ncbi:MAG: ABC transporter permease subunit [Verrucomicrobium sp.]|nr:ABC transporter permease subunit [Verrucomicrobium sp.]
MSSPHLSPDRFQSSKWTLFVDGFMTRFIKTGGLVVITAVLGIFVFILSQIIPLFQGAKVGPLQTVDLPAGKYLILGVDEGGELPFVMRDDGQMSFIDVEDHNKVTQVDPLAEVLAATASVSPAPASGASAPAARPTITASFYSLLRQEVIVGTSDGRFGIIPINYSTDWASGDSKTVQAAKAEAFALLDKPGVPIRDIGFGNSGDTLIIAGVQDVGDVSELRVVRMTRQSSLMGEGELKVDKTYDLTPLLKEKPAKILVSTNADSLLVLGSQGEVEYFFYQGDQFVLRQQFRPFKDLKDPTVASLNFLFGDVSIVVTSTTGENRVYSLMRPKGADVRQFVETKWFRALPGAASFYSASIRNKAFLTGSGSTASLRYATTQNIRWEAKLPFQVADAAIDGKFNRILFLDADAKLHSYSLVDPHPEISYEALFGKIWYEGYSEPSYQWQSTGGSDEFEPKFSLVPLIIGTLKGTLYAMIFAVPIALFAAIYTSQFLHPKYKAFVKPTMEVMASLPSVVLGFLAALWLAPILEQRVPSVIAVLLVVPLGMIALGCGWNSLPFQVRRLVREGHEFVLVFPVLLLLLWVGWSLGPVIERHFFVVADPATGQKVADFRLWWPQFTGASYEQRNSLVVGLMMGFAVIPLIFTIAEDSLTNVPDTLRSGSLALGASRWQTTMRIVVPTASPGIFSALMIGLGRAVGETMIVVMATGNTPIMDFNIFSGMRTLSANIAVELPEAPFHGTLYRTLFLGAMLLFLMTFLVNTGAEILRQHLREKYRTV